MKISVTLTAKQEDYLFNNDWDSPIADSEEHQEIIADLIQIGILYAADDDEDEVSLFLTVIGETYYHNRFFKWTIHQN